MHRQRHIDARSLREEESMSMEGALKIRKVDHSNVEDFVGLIVELAKFERLPPPGEEEKRRLSEHALSRPPPFEAFIAQMGGKAVGYITYYFTYSTFLAKPTLFLEDIFVLEEHRRAGIGERLFDHCLLVSREKGCGRLEWSVLNWNVNAISFYGKRGGRPLSEWTMYRLDL